MEVQVVEADTIEFEDFCPLCRVHVQLSLVLAGLLALHTLATPHRLPMVVMRDSRRSTLTLVWLPEARVESEFKLYLDDPMLMVEMVVWGTGQSLEEELLAELILGLEAPELLAEMEHFSTMLEKVVAEVLADRQISMERSTSSQPPVDEAHTTPPISRCTDPVTRPRLTLLS
jgi:hypothetical protein